VSYGPNLNGAAIVLGSEGNVPVERTAMLIHTLLGVEVSAGFVARATQRLADTLDTAGFDEAMKAALRGEHVLCGDESPVNVLETTSTRPPQSRWRARRTRSRCVPPTRA
jgi:hypothetical protein